MLTARVEHPAEPIMEMNTTPLIDVLLVLIIMLIITIPFQTHAVKLDLPGPGEIAPVDRLNNKVVVTRSGALLFNGAPVSATRLQQLLDATAQLPSEPELQLQPAADAPYARVDEVLVMSKRAHLTRLGFVGNERYGQF